MRRLIEVALILTVAGVPLQACAQRGGASHGSGSAGHSGSPNHGSGFAGSARTGFQARPSAPGRSSFSGATAAPRFRFGRPPGATPHLRLSGTSPLAIGVNRRPGYTRESRYRTPYLPFYAAGLPVGVGVQSPGFPCLGFDASACSLYDDSGYVTPAPAYADPAGPAADPAYAAYAGAPAYPASAPAYPAGSDGSEPTQQARRIAGSSFRPAYERRVSPDPEPEEAVTRLFRDGRPAEQIHNYILTRTTLYIQDAPHRELPVDELDLAATRKANKDAGVDFALPAGAGQ